MGPLRRVASFLLSAEVGEPVPGEHALGGDDQTGAIRRRSALLPTLSAAVDTPDLGPRRAATAASTQRRPAVSCTMPGFHLIPKGCLRIVLIASKNLLGALVLPPSQGHGPRRLPFRQPGNA